MESAFLRMWDVPSSVIFCSSCILMLPGICCTYFPNPFLISTMTPITSGIVIAFIPQILSTLISRSLYFESLSVTFTEVFFSVEMDISMNTQLVSCLFLITMSGLWPFSQYLFVYIGICHKIVMLSCYCFGLMLRPFLICVYIHLFADVPVEVWPWQLCWCVYVFSIGQLMITVHPATIWWIVSWNWPQILCIRSVPSFRILLRQ